MLPAPRGGSRCGGLEGFGLRCCWGRHGGSEVEDGLCLFEELGVVSLRMRVTLLVVIVVTLSCFRDPHRPSLSYGSRD